jgi:hypothetical protein
MKGVAWSAERIPPVVNLGFLDRSRYYFFQAAPQLSSRGWVDPVPDPLLLRKSGSAGNQTQDLWTCSQKLWPPDHRGGSPKLLIFYFICCSFNDAVSSLGYTASDDRTIDEWLFGDGRAEKLPWPVSRYHPALASSEWGRPQWNSRQSVSPPRFEPGNSRIQMRNLPPEPACSGSV